MSACSRLLLRVCLSRTRWLLPGQKACERRSPVPLHGPRGVRFDVTVGDHEVYDLAEKIERVFGVAGGLNRSNYCVTCARAMRSSGFELKAGSSWRST